VVRVLKREITWRYRRTPWGRQALHIAKGSGEPNRTKVGTITQAQLREIAERKLPDLNAHDVDQAAKIIAGTARSMGVEVAS